MRAYLTEFIGTFFLVLVIALSGNPLAIGAVLIALVYTGGYISGAHYNPAVTLALWQSKKVDAKKALRYMFCQLLGSLAAAAVFFVISGNKFVPKPGANVNFATATLVELLFTFALASAVLHTTATDKTKGNNYYGLAIGLTLMAGIFAGGPISGGVYNPAIGLGSILFDFGNLNVNLNNLLIYLIGPFTGGLLASLVYQQKD